VSRPFCVETTIDQPFDAIATAITHDPASAFANTVWVDQRVAMVPLDVAVGPLDVERYVVLEVGDPYARGTHELVVPLRWRAAHHAGRYPTAEAVLEVLALSNHPPRTQISIVGTYEVPLGWLGQAADRVAGERIVATSVGQLVDEVARRLEAATEGAGLRPAT